MPHSDYVSGYIQLGQVLKTLSIHAQSFAISKQQFFDQPVNQLTSSGVRYTRTPLAARGTATCSMEQTCQVNWTITIPTNILAVQLNRCEVAGATDDNLRARVNFNVDDDITAAPENMTQNRQKNYGKTADDEEKSEHLKFWFGFSTACGPFNQVAILRDAQNLWNTTIYAREQAVICSNSLTDLCINNSINVSPLESIIAGKRHCGIFMGIPLSDIDLQATEAEDQPRTPYYFRIPYDITFSDDFLQDLKIVWLNKSDTIKNRHLAYAMIPPEKSDIVYLLSENGAAPLSYEYYAVRLVNIGFYAVSGSMQSIMSFAKIKALFMTFAMPQYPTWFFPVLFYNFNLVVDQKNQIPQPYKALTQTTNSQIFDCFVDQDVVSAPSDLYHSLTFENVNADDKNSFYGYIDPGGNVGANANIFYSTSLYKGSKATITLYRNKYMLAWKMATDDTFMHGYNSSKIGARTNIQLILNGNLTKGIIDTTQLIPSQNQNDFKQFIAKQSYPDPHSVAQTPIMHYLCDAFIRITFDDNPDPQVLSMDVIGEIGGSSIRSG
ncbi:MAG: hypothetical protein EZS28_000674 [Streblomastix strix]|uniref:Uncharacterized protein n=1 Tax=Streblomastix strix TaxID=222440 RepID=A0A5J4XBC9_9EUKA|nr:MAG: hypothetical protein EZS28_000674 [Streblomastix strix]